MTPLGSFVVSQNRAPIWTIRRARRDPIAFLQAVANDGDVARFSLAGRTAFLVNDPALIELILVRRSEAFGRAPAYRRAARLLGNGLLTVEEPAHRRRRQTMAPAFHRTLLETYVDRIVDRVFATARRWAGEALDVAQEMHRLTLSIVGDVLFGVDLEPRAAEIRGALGATVDSLDPLISLIAPGRRIADARRRLFEVAEDIVRARLEARAPGRCPIDLLSMLLAAPAGCDRSLEQLRDDVLTMLAAGHDTLGTALAVTWMLLAANPEVERRLHVELAEVLGGRAPSADDVTRLTYTRAVLSESLRLFPPAWVIARRALVDQRLGGIRVSSGSIVVISQWLMHRDARFFPDPLVFDPSRWSSARDTRPKLSYFPFGAGPRSCIGESFAWMEGVLILATLAQAWHFRATTLSRLELEPRVTLGFRAPLSMRPEPRS
jgi:cytochrome P450